MRKIVISADDFGRSIERNIAIDKAFKSGMIKSAALIVGARYTEDAVKLAQKGGYIADIHPHLCLASGEQLTGGVRPLSEKMIRCAQFCDGEAFKKTAYYKADFLKYVNVFFEELEQQYLHFIQITNNNANPMHVDFHLYGNLSFPVAVAYRKLIKKYRIRSARYIGIHHIKNPSSVKAYIGNAIIARILNGHKGELACSCNIDYFLTNEKQISHYSQIELYCHPEMVDDEIFDNTTSVFGHPKRNLEENLLQLNDCLGEESVFCSWREIAKEKVQ